MNSNDYQSGAIRTESVISDLHGLSSNGELITINSRLMHSAMGMCTESGELMDMLKKHIFYGKPFDERNAYEELGDLAWYLAIGASALGHPLGNILADNLKKLKVRYPDKFTQEDALNRDIDSELEALNVKNNGGT